MADESNKIQHFSSANNSLFLCVLWKVLFDTEHLPDVAYKVLERIGTKQLTAHLRSFCDLLVLEFSISGNFALPVKSKNFHTILAIKSYINVSCL